MDDLHVRDGKFACEHHLLISLCVKKTYLFWCAVVHLGGSMEGNWRNVHLFHRHILDDECVNPDFVELAYHQFHLLQFLLIDDGVDGDIDLGTEEVCEIYKTLDVIDGIGGRRPCSECWRTDINSVGTVADGLDADVGRSCRRQQFQWNNLSRHTIWLMSNGVV